jgi:Sec-independent protein secretion pathway component TatC
MRILISAVALAIGFVLGAIGSPPDCFTTLDCALPHFILALSTR